MPTLCRLRCGSYCGKSSMLGLQLGLSQSLLRYASPIFLDSTWQTVRCDSSNNPSCFCLISSPGLLFQCSCTWNWLACGGWCPCNVHNDSKPWCPWCRAPQASLFISGELVNFSSLTPFSILALQDHPRWAWTVSTQATVAMMLAAWATSSYLMDDRSPGGPDAVGSYGQAFADDRSRASIPGASGTGDALVERKRSEIPHGCHGGATTGSISSQSEAGIGNELTKEPVWGRGNWRRWRSGAVAAALAFVGSGFALGLVFWLATDYPYFLFFVK